MEKKYILETKNYYRTYFLDEKTRPTIFICPGGGYKYTSPRESEPVVEEFLKRGYHAVVVNYRETIEDAYPLPSTYVGKALDEIKKDSRVGKVIGLGFSAGGHCLLEYTLHYKDYPYGIKPDLLILGYPVITADSSCAHLASFELLLRENVNDLSLRKYLSLETQVTKENTVDLFLWGTYTDQSVPVENSLRLIEAYRKAEGNVEYHLFPFGTHGLSVANSDSSEGKKELENPYVAKWVDFADDWIKLKISR
ncbi:MAG: alpha/beta hydrolase [Roseburia sp.]|nr:alpha/beta hydrolase [Anaeroplasma bactoclasticum]MCM1195876.1 alpha/beta hydrolase [Roseburia sp.]MCM1556536.1 alpha/beta hydrolase [Anaeroplasma bactoclasticum]